jgi:cytochrome c oxidase assembly protein subunit 11
MSDLHPTHKGLRRDMIVAASCGVFVAVMVGAAYAAVPFYNWFCRTTGFGGTTQVSERAPDQVLGRTVKVRFDSNVTPGLPWKFAPEQNEVTVHIGEVITVHYKVTNEAGVV